MVVKSHLIKNVQNYVFFFIYTIHISKFFYTFARILNADSGSGFLITK